MSMDAGKAASISSRPEDADCPICRDEAAVAEVLELLEGRAFARVRTGACVSVVATDLVEDVRPGDRLLIHVGFAIGRLEDA